MKRNLIIISLILVFSLCFSAGAWAEVFEGNCVSNAEVVVDEENNTIEYIYTQSENDVIEGVFEDIPDNAWYNVFVAIQNNLM